MFGKRRARSRVQCGAVEEDAVVAGALELVVDRARHDVARGQVSALVVVAP